ncbi:MAG: glycosyltransferase [Hyphomicrobiaceae bacterium]
MKLPRRRQPMRPDLSAAGGVKARDVFDIDDPRRTLAFHEKWSPFVILKLATYFCMCFIAVWKLPNTIWNADVRHITYVIGILGIWRYAWWMTHAVRARIYQHVVYPRYAARAAELWAGGWRPRHIHFMMTTFREHRDITEAVVRGIVSQVREAGVPATLWLGSGDIFDEDIIERHLELVASDLDITFRIVRQNVSGKRMAIALVLRAMSRQNIPDDDLVVFMDGDFIIDHGALRKCLPLFGADHELQALTTNEDVIVRGAWWMQSWLNMRFAQRRLAMQSHALSGRVLTLTGRMSVFRAHHVKRYEFIRLLEADYLNHWLWGSFRFLSGDDKSTWYYMLSHGARMLYVPDANGYTVEVVKGSAFVRMVENFRRWSGNMLRNGQRAIRLGPGRMPFFIWWCLVDQRVAMWTMLFSPVLAISASIIRGWDFFVAYVIFIAVTRMLLSLLIFQYSRRVDLNYVWILYVNQLTNAAVKIYMLWRLAKQKWSNRGDQRAGFGEDGFIARFREGMALYLTVLSVAGLFLAVIVYSRLLNVPSWDFISAML